MKTPDSVYDWMERKQLQKFFEALLAQAAKAETRGFKKTLISPRDLRRLIDMATNDEKEK